MEPVFSASITVLVFLLPAAGLVGSYMVKQSLDAIGLTGRRPSGAVASVNAAAAAERGVREDLGRIIGAAHYLRVGFACTLVAVIFSSIAMLYVGVEVKICSPRITLFVDGILGGAALGLLVGAGLTVFPMTWLLLELDTVRRVYEALRNAQGAGGAGTEPRQGGGANGGPS